jgi:hypothetical protein
VTKHLCVSGSRLRAERSAAAATEDFSIDSPCQCRRADVAAPAHTTPSTPHGCISLIAVWGVLSSLRLLFSFSISHVLADEFGSCAHEMPEPTA